MQHHIRRIWEYFGKRHISHHQPLMLVVNLIVVLSLMFSLGTVNVDAKIAPDEIEDQDITLAVQNALMLDPRVASHLIDVQATDGIVTLSGSVDHLLARDQAVDIAEHIKGVRAVVNQLTVMPVSRPDENIRADVERALGDDPVTDSYEILVSVENGVVTLTGSVESWDEKHLTTEVVKGIRGVRDIRNRLTITYREERADQDIKAEVKRRLSIDPAVNDLFIEVSVENGTVILSGTVGTAAEKTQAYNNAWVGGVEAVDDSALQVDWSMRNEMKRKVMPVQSDQEMHQAILDAFLYDPRVSTFDIDVEVENGTATLTGTVDNLEAKNAAEKDAKHTTGIWRVKNYVTVRPVEPPSDAEIAQNVRDALSRDIIVDRFQISVTVFNQKVWLYGTVDSDYEKQHATEVVSGVKGVVDVRNSLKVETDWTWKSDQAIREDIQDEYFWSFLVDGSDISVLVENGEATLIGVVDSWNEYGAAVDNAFQGGVRRVKSHLKVKDSPIERDYPIYHEHRDYR